MGISADSHAQIQLYNYVGSEGPLAWSSSPLRPRQSMNGTDRRAASTPKRLVDEQTEYCVSSGKDAALLGLGHEESTAYTLRGRV